MPVNIVPIMLTHSSSAISLPGLLRSFLPIGILLK